MWGEANMVFMYHYFGRVINGSGDLAGALQYRKDTSRENVLWQNAYADIL